MLGEDWYEYGDWGFEIEDNEDGTPPRNIDPSQHSG